MKINFNGYNNAGSLVINNPKSKKVITNCLFTNFNNILRPDYRKSENLLNTFTRGQNVLFLSVDSLSVSLKESTIKTNNEVLKFQDEHLGKLSMISKFLKKFMESDDRLFWIDFTDIDKISTAIQKDAKAPKEVKKLSAFQLYNPQNAKEIAKKMFNDIETKMIEYLKV